MKNIKHLIIISSLCSIFVVLNASAQQNAEGTVSVAAKSDGIHTAANAKVESEVSVQSEENTLDKCRDKKDNDQDSFVDCADQDCGIYAICAAPPQVNSETASEAIVPQAEKESTAKDTVQIFERGRLCRDGLDNDNDGLADCHDTKCQSSRYCKKEMYEYPYSPYKAPGIFFQLGLGLALPNYNWKDVRVDSDYGNRIPFDPDTGVMMNFKVGVLPIPWLGVGMNINMGGTFASNRADFISIADDDKDYKYDGYKAFGHIGAFVRLQYPTRRFTAYMDIAGGTSFARYKWRVYDGANSWSDINSDWDDDDWDDDWDNDSDDIEHDSRYKQAHHFSLVLEPGFDYYVIERKVGVGMHAWLPVYASSNAGMDNVGILFNVTFTPTWREAPRLKEEYK